MKWLKVEHSVAAPGALTGASNFFELAVATAIALYGPEPGAALATVVGVLVEVPVMLSVRGLQQDPALLPCRSGCVRGKMIRRVLILCTGNSPRRQMAEGLLREAANDRFDVYSAGTKPARVRPEAIAVMAELAIDISLQRSKSVNEFIGQELDYVITVCDNANQTCPHFPGTTARLHWPFEDPAAVEGTDDERKDAFRKVRDQIRARIMASLVSPHRDECDANRLGPLDDSIAQPVAGPTNFTTSFSNASGLNGLFSLTTQSAGNSFHSGAYRPAVKS